MESSRYLDQHNSDTRKESYKGLPVGTNLKNNYGAFHRLISEYWQVSTRLPDGTESSTVMPKGDFKRLPLERRFDDSNSINENILSLERAKVIHDRIIAASEVDLLPGENFVNPFRETDDFNRAMFLIEAANYRLSQEGKLETAKLDQPTIAIAVRRLMNLE